MRPNHARRQLCVLVAAFLAIFCNLTADAAAQRRWRAVTLQTGVATGTSDFWGIGTSVAGELGLLHGLRAFAQWTDWQAVARCSIVADGSNSECEVDTDLIEVGLRQGIRVGPGAAPFVGAGFGIYHRRDFSGGDPTNDYVLSVSAGLDIAVASPLAVRLSLVHEEVIGQRITGRYPTGLRFTGFLVGLGLAVW